MLINDIPVDEQELAAGKLPLAYTRQVALVKRVALLELLGFVTISTCLVLMRFKLYFHASLEGWRFQVPPCCFHHSEGSSRAYKMASSSENVPPAAHACSKRSSPIAA